MTAATCGGFAGPGGPDRRIGRNQGGRRSLIPMTSPADPPDRRATLLGALTVLPLLVWWAGWAPAIMTSDSIDQWNQALSFEFFTAHPITHTASLWLVSIVWSSPAAVTLVHVVATSGLLALVARRLVQIGVPMWFAVGTVWGVAVLPMTGAMTVTMWKDVPFSLAMLWVATELLLMARDRAAFWQGLWGPARLGVALGLVWAFRANGRLTALVFFVALLVGFRTRWRGLATAGAAMAGVGVVMPAALVLVLPVTSSDIEPAQVFMPDVAAVVVNDPADLSAADLDLVVAVAPIAVYEGFYACGDSTPLLFHPDYDNAEIRANPSAYRALIVRTGIGSLDTVLGHRWCAAEYLLSPVNRTGTFVHRPPFDIWPNTLGLARDPISGFAYDATLGLYQAVERPGIEWLTWRPALVILAGMATFAAVMSRRPLRPLGWLALFWAMHLGNVILTSPAHEFRYAYGLWLISLVSIPLWALVADPGRSRMLATDRSTGVRRAFPSADEPAGDPDRQPERGDGGDVGVSDEIAAGHPVDRQEDHR